MRIYGDQLNRLQTVIDLTDVVKSCVATKSPTTFSLEGEWGKGKSWTVDRLADSLEGKDLTATKETSNEIKGCNSYLVFRYNAWEQDYYEEPLLAILITLINQLNKELLLENIIKGEFVALFELSKDILTTALQSISQRVIGIDVISVGKRWWQIAQKAKKAAQLPTTADYSEDNITKDITTVVSALNNLAEQIPIVFIVDELDRCLPEHAIKTLERLHHIFGKVNSSVTIISVNEAQLKTTVTKMFGDDIPFESYLQKFVDFRISLDSGNADVEELKNKRATFFALFGEDGDEDLADEVLTQLCNKMTARDFEKVCSKAMLCHNLVGKDTSFLSKDYALAELLLFACKVAFSKEDSRSSYLPIYSNSAQSDLGKYLKEFFSKLPRRRDVFISSSIQRVCYICMKALLTSKELETNYAAIEITMDMAAVTEYYDEFIRYYKLLK